MSFGCFSSQILLSVSFILLILGFLNLWNFAKKFRENVKRLCPWTLYCFARFARKTPCSYRCRWSCMATGSCTQNHPRIKNRNHWNIAPTNHCSEPFVINIQDVTIDQNIVYCHVQRHKSSTYPTIPGVPSQRPSNPSTVRQHGHIIREFLVLGRPELESIESIVFWLVCRPSSIRPVIDTKPQRQPNSKQFAATYIQSVGII